MRTSRRIMMIINLRGMLNIGHFKPQLPHMDITGSNYT